jgi:hypothetical protein
MDTEPAEVNDQKTDTTEDGAQVVDPEQVPQRLYVKFRCGVHLSDEKSVDMLDEFKGELATEMAFAIKKTMNTLNKDGSRKYGNFICINEMKISHEMQEWIQF